MPTGYKIGLTLGLVVVIVAIILWTTLGGGQGGDDVAMGPQPEPIGDDGGLGHLPEPPAKLQTDLSITDLDPGATPPKTDDAATTDADTELTAAERAVNDLDVLIGPDGDDAGPTTAPSDKPAGTEPAPILTLLDDTDEESDGQTDPIGTEPDEVVKITMGQKPPSSLTQRLEPASTPLAERSRYTVQRNDNFWVIAEKVYEDGTTWRAIAQANPLVDPQRLKIGQVIRLPGAGTLPPPPTRITPPVPTPDRIVSGKGRTITVRRGDTLYDLAAKHYGKGTKWRQIHAANRAKIPNPNALKVGTVLVIPPAK